MLGNLAKLACHELVGHRHARVGVDESLGERERIASAAALHADEHVVEPAHQVACSVESVGPARRSRSVKSVAWRLATAADPPLGAPPAQRFASPASA